MTCVKDGNAEYGNKSVKDGNVADESVEEKIRKIKVRKECIKNYDELLNKDVFKNVIETVDTLNGKIEVTP